MYDLYAPIVPCVGMGGFLLNMSRKEAEAVLGYPLGEGKLIRSNTLEEYIIDNALALYFSAQTDRLKGIETRKDYKGLLMGKIGTSTDEDDLTELDPTLIYDDFEEFYDSKMNHYQIQTPLPARKAEWISIYTIE